ncbi:MAG: Sua5/YciO/YrdC/YwlC family protein, partial [Pseudomonadota bacterium]
METPAAILPADAPEAVPRAVEILSADGLAALPTETVYGLCARAESARAVCRVFAVKGRPAKNPLIVHGASAQMLKDVGVFTAAADTLAKALWPGPLTLVLARASGAKIADAACAGGPTVALRVPQAAVLCAVSERIGPLVA